jgi:hypothetical protein
LRTLSRDTSPKAEQVQIELLRSATPARRFALSQSMTSTALLMQQRALRALHPEAADGELRLLALALNYGDDLAARVRAHLEVGRT